MYIEATPRMSDHRNRYSLVISKTTPAPITMPGDCDPKTVLKQFAIGKILSGLCSAEDNWKNGGVFPTRLKALSLDAKNCRDLVAGLWKQENIDAVARETNWTGRKGVERDKFVSLTQDDLLSVCPIDKDREEKTKRSPTAVPMICGSCHGNGLPKAVILANDSQELKRLRQEAYRRLLLPSSAANHMPPATSPYQNTMRMK